MQPVYAELAGILCSQVDWSLPGLKGSAMMRAHRRGDDLASAAALVRHLRRRRKPLTGFTRSYATELRAAAGEAGRAKAAAAIDAALEADPAKSNRGSPAIGLDPQTLMVGIDAARFERYAARMIDSRPNWAQWGRCGWGTCHALSRGLRALLPLPECDDVHFVPLLTFLVEQAKAEWSWSKSWDEALLGTSGHNYWSHCYGGLAQAGLLFPEFLPLARFSAFLPEWFEHELNVLMATDGFTRERSGYHWGTADGLIDLANFAQINGRKLSARALARLQAIHGVDWRVISPDGDLPYVGDTGHRRSGSLLGRLRLEAAWAGIGEAKYVAEKLSSSKLARGARLDYLGQDIAPAYRALKPVKPASTETSLPDSGYYFVRTDWSPRADWACIDAGTRGNIVTSHDHACVFHLLMHSRGTAVLVDNYSGHYGDSPARTWRVGSSSHNLATVDEQDIVPFRNEWRWDAVVAPAVQEWSSGKKHAYFSAVHEGYARLTPGVPGTRRKLFYLRGDYWVLIDRFTAASREDAHTYDQHFHLAKPASLARGGRVATTGPGGNLLILPVAGAAGEATLEPNPHPVEGFENPAHLRYRQKATGHGLFVTLLVPFDGEKAPRVEAKLIDVELDGGTATPWEATGLEIKFNGRRDVYVDQHMEWVLPFAAGGVKGATKLFHSRVHGGGNR